MTAVGLGHFFMKSLVCCVVRNSSLTTCRIVMKLNGVLDYHRNVCILLGINALSQFAVFSVYVLSTKKELGVLEWQQNCVLKVLSPYHVKNYVQYESCIHTGPQMCRFQQAVGAMSKFIIHPANGRYIVLMLPVCPPPPVLIRNSS